LEGDNGSKTTLKEAISSRMTKHLQTDMQHLQDQVLTQWRHVERMLDMAARSLANRSADLAAEVIQDDKEVDAREVAIEEECLNMLALHQPVAVDLRRIATVLKVNSDLERIADLAVNLAERGVHLAQSPAFPSSGKLTEMITLATQMTQDALSAFLTLDASAAKSVTAVQDQIESQAEEVLKWIGVKVKETPSLIPAALHCFSASRHVERIGSHAANIAEDVIYLVEGEIVRHQH
jgi:phosphate transport system protein